VPFKVAKYQNKLTAINCPKDSFRNKLCFLQVQEHRMKVRKVYAKLCNTIDGFNPKVSLRNLNAFKFQEIFRNILSQSFIPKQCIRHHGRILRAVFRCKLGYIGLYTNRLPEHYRPDGGVTMFFHPGTTS